MLHDTTTQVTQLPLSACRSLAVVVVGVVLGVFFIYNYNFH